MKHVFELWEENGTARRKPKYALGELHTERPELRVEPRTF